LFFWNVTSGNNARTVLASSLIGKEKAMTSARQVRNTARRFLQLLHEPGDVLEIRSFDCPHQPGADFTSTHSGYFDDIDRAAKEAARLDQLKPVGCTSF
jgi:hypothetical protein